MIRQTCRRAPWWSILIRVHDADDAPFIPEAMKHMFKYLNYTSIPVAPGFPLAPYLCLTWQQMAISFATSFPRLDGTQPRRPKFSCQRACGAPFFVLSFFFGRTKDAADWALLPRKIPAAAAKLFCISLWYLLLLGALPKGGEVTYSHRSLDVDSIFTFWRLIFKESSNQEVSDYYPELVSDSMLTSSLRAESLLNCSAFLWFLLKQEVFPWMRLGFVSDFHFLTTLTLANQKQLPRIQIR